MIGSSVPPLRFLHVGWHSPATMPIRPEHRFFYPIDWAQLSAVIRFGRARSRCEGCRTAARADDLPPRRWPLVGRQMSDRWRDGWGRRIRIAAEAHILGRIRRTRVVLTAAHRDHDTSNYVDANLAAFCQRCHMIHDWPEHQRRRWRTLFRRKALGDLFGGPYALKFAVKIQRSVLGSRDCSRPISVVGTAVCVSRKRPLVIHLAASVGVSKQSPS